MASRNTYRRNAPIAGHHRPESYYYDDVPDRSYRRGPVGVADEGDDDDDEPEDDEETAVATDLSLMPPRPTQNSRAGFRSNPISDQVEFDKEAAPATVGPRRPKPKTATFAEPPRQAQTLQVPTPMRREAPRQPQRQQQLSRYDESHDDDPESDEEDTVVDDDPYVRRGAPPRAQPIRQQYAASPPPPRPSPSQAYSRSSPAPPYQQQRQQTPYYPPHQQLQYRQSPHGFSSLADEPEDEAEDSDEDAFTAVGTGVATDLSLDDDEAIPMGRGQLGYQEPYGQGRGSAPMSRSPGYCPDRAAPAAQPRRQPQYADEYDDEPPRQLAPPPSIRRPSSSNALRASPSPTPAAAPPRQAPDLPQDSIVEKELIQLLKEMNFSVALKDLHDHLGLGVQKTLVAEDGMGHAYCKVHCKKLPRHDAVEREPHLKNHWVPLAGARWEFRTTSHRVTIVWKTTAVGAYESAGLLGRR
ncbi:hypothetical protein BCR35DRAFT_333259 [Leucosporidium creatinivorum]|uniref:Uncharacterized protein n=1 Tax=Leucosporidium creatinivorum TaxID=106004 RepID=A0A1Y2EU29_9BASI|nr:hypothetical protein BCR35DRAFT_333259 [Leucosporidium creatinivorum]